MYQHKVPQDNLDHEVSMKLIERVSPYSRVVEFYEVCSTCEKPVKKVPLNEGPESLKALLRF